MTTAMRAAIAAAVAIAVLVVGGVALVSRPATYSSQVSVLLVPDPAPGADRDPLLAGFDDSLTHGTYAELLTTQARRLAAGVEVGVRAVPDSRILVVSAQGDRDLVQQALSDVVGATRRAASQLDDDWTMRTIEDPSAPVASRASGVGFAGVLVLAGFAALLVWLGLGASGSRGGAPGSRSRDGEDAGDGASAAPANVVHLP